MCGRDQRRIRREGTSDARGLQRVEFSELFLESAAREGVGGVADGAAPVALDGVGGSPSAGEEEGEGVAEVAELADVAEVEGCVIVEGDAQQSKEGEIGCVGTDRGDGILGPLEEEVEMATLLQVLSAMDSIGLEIAWTDLVAVIEEVVFAPADVEASILGVPAEEKE